MCTARRTLTLFPISVGQAWCQRVLASFGVTNVATASPPTDAESIEGDVPRNVLVAIMLTLLSQQEKLLGNATAALDAAKAAEAFAETAAESSAVGKLEALLSRGRKAMELGSIEDLDVVRCTAHTRIGRWEMHTDTVAARSNQIASQVEPAAAAITFPYPTKDHAPEMVAILGLAAHFKRRDFPAAAEAAILLATRARARGSLLVQVVALALSAFSQASVPKGNVASAKATADEAVALCEKVGRSSARLCVHTHIGM